MGQRLVAGAQIQCDRVCEAADLNIPLQPARESITGSSRDDRAHSQAAVTNRLYVANLFAAVTDKLTPTIANISHS